MQTDMEPMILISEVKDWLRMESEIRSWWRIESGFSASASIGNPNSKLTVGIEEVHNR